MSYILWRRLLLRRSLRDKLSPPFRWPLLLPTATRGVLATHCGLTLYKERVAEVAVFVTKKFLQNLNFRKFLPQEF